MQLQEEVSKEVLDDERNVLRRFVDQLKQQTFIKQHAYNYLRSVLSKNFPRLPYKELDNYASTLEPNLWLPSNNEHFTQLVAEVRKKVQNQKHQQEDTLQTYLSQLEDEQPPRPVREVRYNLILDNAPPTATKSHVHNEEKEESVTIDRRKTRMTDLTMKNRHTQDRPSQPLPENNPNIESTSITAFTGFPGKPEPFVASVRMSKLPFNIDAYTEASKLDKNNSLARDFSPRNDSSTRDHAYFKMSRNDKTKNIFSTNASSKVSDARPEQATQKTQPMI